MKDDQPVIPDREWIDTHAPAEGQTVRVQSRDDFGSYVLSFPVAFRDDDWFNAQTSERLECYVAGWVPWDNG
jgi:hypothetical protein